MTGISGKSGGGIIRAVLEGALVLLLCISLFGFDRSSDPDTLPVTGRWQKYPDINPVDTRSDRHEGSLTLLIRPSPTPTATPKPTPTETPVPTRLPTPTPPEIPRPVRDAGDLDYWFTRYSEEYAVDSGLLKRIADCESHFNTNAVNGPYAGIFQFTASSWTSTRRQMNEDDNPDLRFNSEQAIRTAAFKISRGGSGAWPSCSGR